MTVSKGELNLSLTRVKIDASHKADMHAETSVRTGAL